jgi:hypothetical protein
MPGAAIRAEEDTEMTHQHVNAGLVAVMLVLAGPALAGPLDPECSVAKAARGAATKAVVGVRGNRCDAAETARDTLGTDDRDQKIDIDDRDRIKRDGDGELKKVRRD